MVYNNNLKVMISSISVRFGNCSYLRIYGNNFNLQEKTSCFVQITIPDV